MDEELEAPKPEPKISDVEVVLIGVFYAVLDVVDFIPIAGDITDIVAAPMGFYYWMKGINGTAFVVAEILDLIPLVQEVPSRTIGWGITVWLDRHPKALGKLETAIEIADTLEGNVGEAEEAAKENAAREAAQLQSNTVEAGGTRERQPGQETEAGSENVKPSEKTAEGGAEAEEKEKGRPSEERPSSETERGDQAEEERSEETEEESEKRRQKEESEDYEKLMRTKAETPPIEEAIDREFGEVPPFPRPIDAETETSDETPGRTSPGLAEAEQQNKERLANRQKKDQQTENLREPQVAEVDAADKKDDYRQAA